MDWITASYLVTSSKGEVRTRAQALAVEQSIEMPLEAVRDARIREEIVARVADIQPVEHDCYRVTLQLSTGTTGSDPVQIINMVFGNCSLQDDVELEDVAFPDSVLRGFEGPRYGIAGLRELCAVYERPLTCTALKPQGSSVESLAKLCEIFALAGLDVIKDDHGIANQVYAPFAQRLAACQAAVTRAREQTGKAVFYAPNLLGTPREVMERAKRAQDAGVKVVLVVPMLIGLGAFAELAQSFPDLAILAHPGFGGAARISPVWLFGRFFRLLGADAVIYPNYGGRFAYSPELCRALAEASRAPWASIRPAFPVPAGGMPVERVDEMIAFYGTDVMLLIGGSLLAAGDALLERSRTFVAAVERTPVR
jgi:ribulose-bisphosphate carboxylase large chain